MESYMKYNYLIVAVIILVGLTSAGLYAEESPWPMFRHDLKHTGHTPYTGPATPTVAWTFPANDGITSSPSIGHDGTIYVGAGGYYDRFGYNTGGGDSSLYAINPDGTLKWQFKTDYGTYSAGIFSSPAIGPDGTVYFGALDHYVYALEDSTTYGKLKWKVRLDENPVYSSPALGYDGTIYVGSLDFRLYALNPQGTIKWNYGTTWCIFSSPAIGSDGTVYVGSKNHLLYVLEDSVTYGKLRWWYITGQFYDGHLVDSSPAIGPDGTIYFGTDPYGAWGRTPVHVDTSFWAVNPDGTLKWAFETGDGVESSPAIGPDGTIYFGSYDSCLYALTDNGNQGVLKWKFRTNGPIDCSPTVDGDGIIYFGSRDSTLYALYPDGSIRWTFPANGGFESSPTIDGNGYLYVGNFDGNLYALGTGAPDIGVVFIHIPEEVKIDSTYLPIVTVRNYRATPQSFDVACLIDTQGHYVYGDTVHVSELIGGGMSQEIFSPWTVGSDTGVVYSITTVTLLSEDDNVINDTLSKEVISVGQPSFIHGDANGDEVINIADVVYLTNYLFIDGPAPEPLEAGDANCDEAVDVGDWVYLINYLFVGGPPPAC
jgi:outer membrane protein assembly factor BamB